MNAGDNQIGSYLDFLGRQYQANAGRLRFVVIGRVPPCTPATPKRLILPLDHGATTRVGKIGLRVPIEVPTESR